MTLKQRQIKAVEATLKRVLREYKEGEEKHNWNADGCSLCDSFQGKPSRSGIPFCSKCPFRHLGYEFPYCIKFFRECYEEEYSYLENIAGFLKSLLITLEA